MLAVALGAVLSFQASACSTRRRASAHPQQRMVILAFDGMDPALTSKWMDEGRRRVRPGDDSRCTHLEPAVGRQVVSIMDIAPTVLKYSGVEIPGEIDGQPLF